MIYLLILELVATATETKNNGSNNNNNTSKYNACPIVWDCALLGILARDIFRILQILQEVDLEQWATLLLYMQSTLLQCFLVSDWIFL